MLSEARMGLETGLSALRALSEPTRLRMAMLLATGEFTVKDLTRILGQSQPRISRHLKLMHDAGLLARVQEGSWVYFRLTDQQGPSALFQAVLARFDTDDDEFRRDRERADAVRRERFEHAQAFFANHAGEWDELRRLHADEAEVESRIHKLLEPAPRGLLVDMGTGTGRILELLAGRFARAIGIDTNQEMLAYARARIETQPGALNSLSHVQVRHGDICNLNLPDRQAAAVIMHQVLHYLPDPRRAIAEAARILEPTGKLLIIDFAAHTIDRLRDAYAHQRLGFTADAMAALLREQHLALVKYENLPPAAAAGPDALTVSFWLAEPLAQTPSPRAKPRNLENAK